ncbi:SoxR reducing system RseC family protein [Proteinivorax tanatarense]|uniref:SoxR reducing system RseC family protein n=1 Tax=Proteinivorax tanatarense TaxID=1260629 RepID=A0AAU7VP28_9FIRM
MSNKTYIVASVDILIIRCYLERMLDMENVGTVVEVQGDKAVVEVQRHSSCSKCGACNMGSEKSKLITAENKVKANEGQKVLIDMATVGVLRAASIVYIIPLIALFFGFLITTNLLDGNEGYGMLGGIVIMIITFLIINRLEPRFNKNKGYKPTITEIIDN